MRQSLKQIHTHCIAFAVLVKILSSFIETVNEGIRAKAHVKQLIKESDFDEGIASG